MTYRLLTYSENGRAAAGVLIGDRVFRASDLLVRSDLDASSVLALLGAWEKADIALANAAESPGSAASQPLDQIALLSPVLYPGAVYCAAANYRDHMHAMAVKLNQPDEPDPRELDVKPYHFSVPARSCIVGPNEAVRLPPHGKYVDWEIELVAVIGRHARRVSPDHALEYVAAYTIGNDLSVRDLPYLKIPNVPAQSLFRSDFIGMKGFDQSCLVGPWLTPARCVADPQKLSMKLWIGDELMQDSTTGEMIFSVAEQISYLSTRVTLLPGDIVMTGTPAGTGMERDRFLRPGETIRLSIEGLGEMKQLLTA